MSFGDTVSQPQTECPVLFNRMKRKESSKWTYEFAGTVLCTQVAMTGRSGTGTNNGTIFKAHEKI